MIKNIKNCERQDKFYEDKTVNSLLCIKQIHIVPQRSDEMYVFYFLTIFQSTILNYYIKKNVRIIRNIRKTYYLPITEYT
jgi:hypothetical protein